MNIKIIDKVGLATGTVVRIADSLLKNRPPEQGSFDYGLETYGVFEFLHDDLEYPIQASQTNRRNSDKSPIEITICRHRPII